MRLRVLCLDLTSSEPVVECRVTCSVTVAPRRTRTIEIPDGDTGTVPVAMLLPIDDFPQPGDTGNGTVEVPFIVMSQAVVLPLETATTSPSGAVTFEVDLSREFTRLAAANDDRDDFFDVVALVLLGGSADGLSRSSLPVLTTRSTDSPTGEVDLERLFLMDFAKAIVGHTTERESRLWFQLHGQELAGRRYECEVDELRSDGSPVDGSPLQLHRVTFDEPVTTKVLDLAGLLPGRTYGFQLRIRPSAGSTPRIGRVLAGGSFTTAGADERELTLFFGSCHKPFDSGFLDPSRDMRHWRSLADRTDGDLQLMIGDQVYGDEVPTPAPGERWFDGYVRRYNQFWSFQPLRQALARRPTYMTLDDHEVTDDWGVDDEIPDERIDDAVDVFRAYQLAYSPSGRDGQVHYHFRRGPVAFFSLDSRTCRGKDDEFPILGRRQVDDLRRWATSPEVLDADVVVLVSAVPIALLPIGLLRRIAELATTGAGVTAGVIAGAAVGFFIGGPAGAGVGASFGGAIGGAGAHIYYDAIEEDKLIEADATDMWSFESNQRDLVRVLDVLFDLATDRPRNGARPRLVFVLGGDSHFGFLHLIASDHDEDGGVDHGTNPLIFQATSSAIGRRPQNQEEMRALFRDVDENPANIDSLKGDLVGLLNDTAERFVLDDEQGEHYRAQCLGALFERTLGKIHMARSGEGRRYRIEVTIEGETRSLVQMFDVDLDARPVTWRSLIGEVLAAEGEITTLRVHEVGSGFGAAADRLDVEVVVQLDAERNRSFGFQLRRDEDEEVRTAMLGELREAFNHRRRVRLDYRRTGIRNGEIIRVMAPG